MYSLGLSSGVMMMMVMMIFGSVILDLLQAAGTRRLSESTRTGTGPALLLKSPRVKLDVLADFHLWKGRKLYMNCPHTVV